MATIAPLNLSVSEKDLSFGHLANEQKRQEYI